MIHKEDMENIENSGGLRQKDYYDFLKFESLSKTRNFPFQEWVGQVDDDTRTIVINYRGGDLKIAIERTEIKARNNMVSLAVSPVHDNNLTIEKMIKALELTWILPSGYIEEI